MSIEKLKFPIGKCSLNKDTDKEQLTAWTGDIESFPKRLERALNGVSVEQLNNRYRPGGWTVKQVVHHCADSHMNGFIRCKLALTEENPTIRPYLEGKWACLVDAQDDRITDSLCLLKGLHKKWGALLRALTTEQFQRRWSHPEHGRQFSIAETAGIYAWHGNHHLAHVENGIQSRGKYN